MKHINEYIDDKVINEGLLSWLKAFIKKLKGNQNKLIENDKVNMLKMDVNKLKYQNEPVSLIELSKDRETLDIWKNNKVGFPESYMIAKNLRKYSPDQGETKSDPYVYTFYYNGESLYYAGIIIYDKNIQYIDNFPHIISIETNLVVDNPSDVQTAMFNQFKTIMKKKYNELPGFTAKLVHPKMKGILTNLRFKQSEDNEEIYKIEL